MFVAQGRSFPAMGIKMVHMKEAKSFDNQPNDEVVVPSKKSVIIVPLSRRMGYRYPKMGRLLLG